MNSNFTKAEEKLLRKHYPLIGSQVQRYIPNKTKMQLVSAATRRGLRRTNWMWNKEELTLLKIFYKSKRTDEVAYKKLLKTRNRMCIFKKGSEIGLAKKKPLKKITKK